VFILVTFAVAVNQTVQIVQFCIGVVLNGVKHKRNDFSEAIEHQLSTILLRLELISFRISDLASMRQKRFQK
jgi:hypothetical protein